MKSLRILALVHDHLVPPEDTTGMDVLWRITPHPQGAHACIVHE